MITYLTWLKFASKCDNDLLDLPLQKDISVVESKKSSKTYKLGQVFCSFVDQICPFSKNHNLFTKNGPICRETNKQVHSTKVTSLSHSAAYCNVNKEIAKPRRALHNTEILRFLSSRIYLVNWESWKSRFMLKVEVHFHKFNPKENVSLNRQFLGLFSGIFETETEELLSLPVSKGKKLRTRKLVKLKKVTDITL